VRLFYAFFAAQALYRAFDKRSIVGKFVMQYRMKSLNFSFDAALRLFFSLAQTSSEMSTHNLHNAVHFKRFPLLF
jgi:hypothetical protein